MMNQPDRSAHRASRQVIERIQFKHRDEFAIVSVGQVVHDFDFRTFRDAHKTRKLLVAESPKAFGNVARPRASGFAQLVAQFVLSSELRAFYQRVNAPLELIRELPSNDLREMFPPSHAVTKSKRRTVVRCADFGEFG
ncbi:MAG TPA: hypothetical protein VL919_02915 [Vicinamibacterales bacterium]|nr:hypothetical protein [Vicinamibacterales bacterium]